MESSQPLIENKPVVEWHAPRIALMALAFILLAVYFGAQIALAIPVGVWAMTVNPEITQEQLLEFEPLIWAGVIGLGVGALGAAVVAGIWPYAWRLVMPGDPPAFGEWLGWKSPRRLPLWLIGLITVPFTLSVTVAIFLTIGEAEVDVQLQMFSTPMLRLFTPVVVSTVVPLAEELIFRGALYQALLPRRAGISDFARHALPVAVTTVLFAAIHLLAGFQNAPEIAEIALLALYLGLLRAITGSVQASVVGHVVWNLLGSAALVLYNLFPS